MVRFFCKSFLRNLLSLNSCFVSAKKALPLEFIKGSLEARRKYIESLASYLTDPYITDRNIKASLNNYS